MKFKLKIYFRRERLSINIVLKSPITTFQLIEVSMHFDIKVSLRDNAMQIQLIVVIYE